MNNEFNAVIDKKVFENYLQALIIDVEGDALYKYVNKENTFVFESNPTEAKVVGENLSSIYRYIKLDLPTPTSPIINIFIILFSEISSILLSLFFCFNFDIYYFIF